VEVLRVGGVTPKVLFRLHYKTIPIKVSREQALTLAQLLYRKVLLRGVAEWDVETREIQGFRLDAIDKVYEHTSPVQAFAALKNEFGHLFKQFD